MADSPRDVALLSPCSWPEVRRGTERMFRDLAAGLIGRGHNVSLITSHAGWPSRQNEDGLEVLRSWRPPEGRLRRRGYEEHLGHVPASYLALRGRDPDLAQASHAPDALAAARWSARTGRPALLSFMGIPDHWFLASRRLRVEILLRAARDCAAVTALSRHAAEGFWRWLRVEARVIHPGVDVEKFRPGGDRAERPEIFCAASLEVGEKQVDLLLAALPLVRRERPDVRLVLQRPNDPRLAASVAAEDGVALVAPDPELLLGCYRRAWVSALPSRSDAFGLVLVESLACGTPVAASDQGALPEVVDRPEVGRSFAGSDSASVARALLEALELSEDPATAPACRARAEDFSLQRCAHSYERLYEELLAAA